MLRLLIVALGLGAAAYLAACAAMFVLQRSLIYYPQPRTASVGGAIEWLQVDDAKLQVSVRQLAGPKALIYFGGNAEDVALNMPQFAAAFPQHAIFLLHYRGYGGSSGSPSEAAIQRDALALFDRVHAQHAQVAVIGRSLGSGLAVRLASARPLERLVLITPFDSLQEIAAAAFPAFPVRLLLRDKYESWRYAPQVQVPTVLIGAEHDEIIPRSSTERLLTRFASGQAVLSVVPGSDHNDISDSPQYLALLRAAL